MKDYSVGLVRVWVCVMRAAEAGNVALLLSIQQTTDAAIDNLYEIQDIVMVDDIDWVAKEEI